VSIKILRSWQGQKTFATQEQEQEFQKPRIGCWLNGNVLMQDIPFIAVRAAREIGYPEYIHKFNLMFSCRDARMPFCQDLERPIGTLCRAPESIEYVKRCSQKRLKNFAILISVQGARRI